MHLGCKDKNARHGCFTFIFFSFDFQNVCKMYAMNDISNINDVINLIMTEEERNPVLSNKLP